MAIEEIIWSNSLKGKDTKGGKCIKPHTCVLARTETCWWFSWSVRSGIIEFQSVIHNVEWCLNGTRKKEKKLQSVLWTATWRNPFLEKIALIEFGHSLLWVNVDNSFEQVVRSYLYRSNYTPAVSQTSRQ